MQQKLSFDNPLDKLLKIETISVLPKSLQNDVRSCHCFTKSASLRRVTPFLRESHFHAKDFDLSEFSEHLFLLQDAHACVPKDTLDAHSFQIWSVLRPPSSHQNPEQDGIFVTPLPLGKWSWWGLLYGKGAPSSSATPAGNPSAC